MKVTWGRRALLQLRDAYAYIAQDDKQAARKFLVTIENLCRLLSIFPKMGVETDELGVVVFPLVRYHHLIFYTILDDEIRIIRIRHASQNNSD
jgi:toxin ParE1/3/4